MRAASLQTIEEFLAQRRIAMVGVSRDPKDFSRMLFDEFERRGYEMVGVNPATEEVAGKRSFKRLQDVQPSVDAAILMTSPAVTDRVVRDCVQARIRYVWMYRASGVGAVSENAVDFCRANGVLVVPGECPFMFMEGAQFWHPIHGFVNKATGKYPKRLAAS